MDELEEERNSNEVWPEERLSELFRILQALCLKYLKATHLLPNLPFLRLHASRITKAERKSSPDATKLLFDLIKDCEEPEKWKKFTLALKEAEFISLYKVCNVCEKNDFDFYIEIYGLLSVDFAEHGVDIVNLSKGMLHSESLTEKQVEKIHLMLQEEGEIAAILEFISCLPSSLESWLTALRSCLFGIDKKDLCKLIQKKGVEIHDYNNIDLDPLIRIYYDRICMRVRPQDIRAFLKSHNLIPDMNLNSLSPSAEMCKILENIEKSEVAGKWRSFLNALKHAGYESLYMKLTNEGGDIDDTQQIELLKSLTPKISKSIDMTVELLSDIRKYELINERCYQEISKKKNESGTLAAAEMLLENIHKFKVGWYNSFLRILTEVGHEEVVKKIDPDFQYSESEKFVDEEGNKVEEYSESEKFVDEEGNKVEDVQFESTSWKS